MIWRPAEGKAGARRRDSFIVAKRGDLFTLPLAPPGLIRPA